MDLWDLYQRLEHALGAERDHVEVELLVPGGARFEILSLNWDDETERWVLIGE